MHRRAISALVLAVSTASLAACGSPTAADSAAQPTRVITVTATPTLSPTPAQAKAAAPPKTHAAEVPTYTMPNEVGGVLQDAQEHIEHILDVPVWPLLKSHDVKEGWRFQVLDRDWKVCDQTPAAGATFTDHTVIDFGVVKTDERCP